MKLVFLPISLLLLVSLTEKVVGWTVVRHPVGIKHKPIPNWMESSLPDTNHGRATTRFSLKSGLHFTARQHSDRQTLLHLSSGSTPLAQPLGLIIFHVLGGLIGVPFVSSAINKPKGVDPKEKGLDGWYTRISLPPWTPPNRLFGPVWTVLYASMGYSLHLVLEHPKVTPSRRTTLLVLWGVHYFSNLIWAPIFFGMKRLRMGLFVNYWLTASLSLWMGMVGHFQPSAALLLIPYLCWLILATALNQAVTRRNPTTHGYNEAMFQSDLLKLRQKAAHFAAGKQSSNVS